MTNVTLQCLHLKLNDILQVVTPLRRAERLRMNEAHLDISFSLEHSLLQPQERSEQVFNQTKDMFESEESFESPPNSKRANVGYQTLVGDVSEMKNQADLTQKMEQRKVKKIKKVTTYAGPEDEFDLDGEAIAKAGIKVNFIKNELLDEKNDMKMPVNLQYIARDDEEGSMMLNMSDTRSTVKMMISKRYKYVFETKMAKLNTIVTVQELKKDRATKNWIITMMKIDQKVQVGNKLLGDPRMN